MKIKLADYLAKRLRLLGIKDVFGLPGDYNFNILDAIEESDDINWINCTNELNAGYAADGYARVNGFGAVVTTFGVGELSAVNAIAGSYAENIPVMKITGSPRTSMIKNNVLLHHNFQKPDYYAFERVYSNVVETTAFLDKNNAKKELDRVFDVMIKTRRPVYVSIPVDVCEILVEDEVPENVVRSNSENLKNAVDKICSIVNNSKRPVFLGDYTVDRYGQREAFVNLVNKTKFPTTTLLMGKSLIDETHECFIGTHLGTLSAESTQKIFNDSDCIICLGTLFSDLNTGGFSIMPDERFRIDIQADYCFIDGLKYEDVWMSDVISGLIEGLEENAHSYIKPTGLDLPTGNGDKLKINEIYPRLQAFLKEDDILFIETGVSSFSTGLIKLPKNANYYSQTLWGSIGWATPAVFGGAMAAKSRRTILFTGEGAHQLTAQEVASMMHQEVKPILFVLNNDGYTIERILSKDPMDLYNEITKWNYSKLPELFGGDFYSTQVRTAKELDEALIKIAQENKTKLCYVELFIESMDVPEAATKAVENIKNSDIVNVLSQK